MGPAANDDSGIVGKSWEQPQQRFPEYPSDRHDNGGKKPPKNPYFYILCKSKGLFNPYLDKSRVASFMDERIGAHLVTIDILVGNLFKIDPI